MHGGFSVVGIRAAHLGTGCIVMQFFNNIIGYFFGLGCKYGKVFAGVHTFNNAVYQKCLCKQPEQGIKSCFHPEYRKRAYCNQKVHAKQRFAHIE